MIKIAPIGTKQEQELICSRLGTAFLNQAMAYKASENDIPVGICQFISSGSSASILCTRTSNRELYSILIRAVMNFCAFNGATSIIYEAKITDTEEKALKTMGFSIQSDRLLAHLV